MISVVTVLEIFSDVLQDVLRSSQMFLVVLQMFSGCSQDVLIISTGFSGGSGGGPGGLLWVRQFLWAWWAWWDSGGLVGLVAMEDLRDVLLRKKCCWIHQKRFERTKNTIYTLKQANIRIARPRYALWGAILRQANLST